MLRQRTAYLSLFTILSSLIILYFITPAPRFPCLSTTTLVPANSTLGFGAILAVSHARSPRRASLLWAANLTDLDITIPEQPEWTERDVQHFRAEEHSSISRGSALAWLGHLNALRWFLTTPHQTALIIEDDTDWSLSIRHSQIPKLATALRHLLTNQTTPSISPPRNANTDPNFWAPPETWDLLYPGHCDDLPAPSTYLSHPHTLYPDPSVPAHHTLHPDTQNFLSSLHMPSHTRLVHRALWPFCTFAYAVTRRSAGRILAEFAREKEGGISAFDVQLLAACRDGTASGEWRCWSVAPEVFHHGVGGSEIGRVDGGVVAQEGGDGGRSEVPERGSWNLQCGARDPGLWVEEDGPREEVRRMVRGMVERGECPLASASREKGWKGCEWGECGAQS